METAKRVDKTNYYLDIAQTVAARGTCLRRNFGAIIVQNDAIIATGYVGAPRGRANCSDLGYCTRKRLGVPAGERYELCRSVHAEGLMRKFCPSALEKVKPWRASTSRITPMLERFGISVLRIFMNRM